MRRRAFIKKGMLSLNAVLLPQLLCLGQDHGHSPYPYHSLNEAFRSISFDPGQEGTAYFVITADVHYGSAGDGMCTTVEAINAMYPRPAFFCVNGDLIVNGSRSFGTIPSDNERRQALLEFKAFKADATKLNPDIPLILTLGNHDTHPREIDPIMFWEVFPEYPPFQSLELEGVHIIFLNGHATGYIDTRQAEWLRKDMDNINNKRTVIIFVHQPSMSHRVRERGIPKIISEIFADHLGEIWLIGGHEHTNGQKIFQLKKTKLIEHHITCGTINIWGGPEKPGYWIYCLKDGQVCGRIYKQRFKGYRIESKPQLDRAQQVPMPFDHITNILWIAMVGEGDEAYLIEAEAKDCLNYWAYVKKLIYRIPLRKNGICGKKIGLLTDHNIINQNKQGQYFLSSNRKDWHEIKLSKQEADVLIFKIPKFYIYGPDLYFKFVPIGEASVGGLALLY